MTEVDLYELLGVERESSADQIKSAYRAMVKRHHPDTGGDPDKFQQIAVAYTVLSDSEKRQEYDLTGKVDQDKAINMMSQIVDAIVYMLDQVLSQTKGRMSDLDIISAMEKTFRGAQANAMKELAEVEARVSDLEDMRKRIKRNNHEKNLFVDIIDGKLREALNQRKSLRETKMVAERAMEEIRHYESPVEMARTMQATMFAERPTFSYSGSSNVTTASS